MIEWRHGRRGGPVGTDDRAASADELEGLAERPRLEGHEVSDDQGGGTRDTRSTNTKRNQEVNGGFDRTEMADQWTKTRSFPASAWLKTANAGSKKISDSEDR